MGGSIVGFFDDDEVRRGEDEDEDTAESMV